MGPPYMQKQSHQSRGLSLILKGGCQRANWYLVVLSRGAPTCQGRDSNEYSLFQKQPELLFKMPEMMAGCSPVRWPNQ